MTSNDPNDARLNRAALSQAERDAAYDNNKVSLHPRLFAGAGGGVERQRRPLAGRETG
jgi:hypothetical protein